MTTLRPLLFVLALALAGCRGVAVIPAEAPGLLDAFQASVPESDVSPRTLQTLRRWDLETVYREQPVVAYARLQAAAATAPEPDVLFALAEMSYLFGKQVEEHHCPDAACYFYLCAGYAYHYLFDPAAGSPYDPRFRLACDLYNAGLGKCIRAAQRCGRLDPRHELHLPTPDGTGFTLSVQHHGFPWRPEEFGPLLFCADYQVVGLANQHKTYGLGVPLIGTRAVPGKGVAHANFPREVSFPVTAFFRFEGNVADLAGHRAGRLELYNPLAAQTITVAGRAAPLETDLTTPLAYFLDRTGNLDTVQLAGFLRPDKVERVRGIYMLEPYQPGKIPVLFVHGLLSSPLTWSALFNDLRADPVLRERYQFWFYLYPTGTPYLETAADLRDELARLRASAAGDPAFDRMVMVGHSMGGLVSKLLTVDSGDGCFWKVVSREPFDRLKVKPDTRRELERIFFFEQTPGVERVVFIGTPHRGSKLSPSLPGRLAASLIELPRSLQLAAQDLMDDNPGSSAVYAKTNDLPTSVDLLAPHAPALEALAQRPRPAGVQYHSIIGQAPCDSTLRLVGYVLGQKESKSDGVVPYDSAHLDGVASEVVVPADHDNVHRHPLAVLEVRRILLEHLQQPPPASTRIANVGAMELKVP